MPQLKVQILELQSEVLPTATVSVFAPDSVMDIEKRINRLSAGSQARPSAETLPEWGVEFVAAFPDCLQTILTVGESDLERWITDENAEALEPEWKPVLEGLEEPEAFFARMSAQILVSVLRGPPLEVVEDPAESNQEDPVEEEADDDEVTPDETEDVEVEGSGPDGPEDGEPRDEAAEDEAKEPEFVSTLIALEYLGEGAVPPKTSELLRTDPRIHEGWRRSVLTAQTLLAAFGDWWGKFNSGDGGKAVIEPVQSAIEELRVAGSQVELSTPQTVPQAVISVPVEPPLHLLVGHPTYDYSDLCLNVAPFLAERMKGYDPPENWNMSVAPDGSRITVKDWSQTASVDQERLIDIFHVLRNRVRRPTRLPDGAFDEAKITQGLDALGCRRIAGVPACWAVTGDDVVGLRPIFHYRSGVFDKSQVQLSMVLGKLRDTPLPEELADQLTRYGTIQVWPDEGLLFVGFAAENVENVSASFVEFVEFGAELKTILGNQGTIEPLEPELRAEHLKRLPPRLEVDFERLKKYWRRRRLVTELTSLIGRGALDAARSLLSTIRDPGDLDHARAVFVSESFGADPEAALAELESVPPGGARHEAMLAVMELASETEREDLLARVFELWSSVDVLVDHYDPSCSPILERVGAGLGLDTVVNGCPGELDAAVLVDWVNFVLRRAPATRRNHDWLARVDGLVNSEKNLEVLDLERLADLYDTVCRYDLAGRHNVVAAAIPLIRGHEFHAYYERRFGINIQPQPVAEAEEK